MDAKFTLLVCCLLMKSTSGNEFGACFTPDEYKGTCVYLNDCPPILEVYNNRSKTFIDRMYVSLSQCGFSDGQPLVCCNNSVPAFHSSRFETKSEDSTTNELLPKPVDCGIVQGNRSPDFENKIKPVEHPWLALLQYKKPGGKFGFHCGGVLISKRYVLTASHCVNGPQIPSTWSLRSVRLGEWDRTTDVDCDNSSSVYQSCNDPPLNIDIEQLITNENYDPKSSSQLYDIALLRLSADVQFTSFIRPICLPSDSNIQNINIESQRLEVAGWGTTEKPLSFPTKMKSFVNGFSNLDCASAYNNRQIVETQLCAGGNDSLNRFGDSGGPLIAQSVRSQPSYFYVVGVSSSGALPRGQAGGWMEVYTRVDNFMAWIEANIQA